MVKNIGCWLLLSIVISKVTALSTILTEIVVALKSDTKKQWKIFCYHFYEQERVTTILIAKSDNLRKYNQEKKQKKE